MRGGDQDEAILSDCETREAGHFPLCPPCADPRESGPFRLHDVQLGAFRPEQRPVRVKHNDFLHAEGVLGHDAVRLETLFEKASRPLCDGSQLEFLNIRRDLNCLDEGKGALAYESVGVITLIEVSVTWMMVSESCIACSVREPRSNFACSGATSETSPRSR